VLPNLHDDEPEPETLFTYKKRSVVKLPKLIMIVGMDWLVGWADGWMGRIYIKVVAFRGVKI